MVRNVVTNTRATDPDSEGRMVQLVRSASFQLITPGLLGLIVTVGGWWAAGMTAKVETIITNMAADHEQVALLKQDVTSLKDTRARRDAEVATMVNRISTLETQVALLRAGVKGQP